MRLNDEGFAGCLQRLNEVYVVEINLVARWLLPLHGTQSGSVRSLMNLAEGPFGVGLATFEQGAANFAAVAGLAR